MGAISWVSSSVFGTNSANKSEDKHILSSTVVLQTLAEQSLMHKYKQNSQILSSLLKYISKKLQKQFIPNISLIFRASQHKFRASAFHQECNGKKNTIFIACTINNKYFGGFTPCAWKKDEILTYQQDERSQSFLFKVQGKELYTYDIKPQHNNKAIMNDNDCGPVFGEGHDINIVDQADKKESWNNLAKSYKSQFKFGSYKANSELAGQEKYTLWDYQIWETKFE